MGIEPTTSGLDLPLLCRLSYEVGQRKSGTIYVVNRGEERVRVHMNVVPRSTMNKKRYPILGPRTSKTISYFAVRTYIAHIWEYPPPGPLHNVLPSIYQFSPDVSQE